MAEADLNIRDKNEKSGPRPVSWEARCFPKRIDKPLALEDVEVATNRTSPRVQAGVVRVAAGKGSVEEIAAVFDPNLQDVCDAEGGVGSAIGVKHVAEPPRDEVGSLGSQFGVLSSRGLQELQHGLSDDCQIADLDRLENNLQSVDMELKLYYQLIDSWLDRRTPGDVFDDASAVLVQFDMAGVP